MHKKVLVIVFADFPKMFLGIAWIVSCLGYEWILSF